MWNKVKLTIFKMEKNPKKFWKKEFHDKKHKFCIRKLNSGIFFEIERVLKLVKNHFLFKRNAIFKELKRILFNNILFIEFAYIICIDILNCKHENTNYINLSFKLLHREKSAINLLN